MTCMWYAREIKELFDCLRSIAAHQRETLALLKRMVPGPAVRGTATITVEDDMPEVVNIPDTKGGTLKLNLNDAAGFLGGTLDAPATFDVDPAVTITPDPSGDLSVYKITRVGVPANEPVSILAHCVGGGTAFDVECPSVQFVASGPAVSGTATITPDP